MGRSGRTLVGRYELVTEIGRGAMGVVYQAEDLLLERQVAVKLLCELHQEHGESVERFQREARLAARLEHPSIVPIYDFGSDEKGLFIVMPLLRGETLRALIKEGRLSRAEALDAGVRIARALGYSHSQGIVHRDVKPENVMVLRDVEDLPPGSVQVKVMDFGVAAAQSERTVTQTGQLVGTLCYASPEQITGEVADGRSDVYSLGAVLYEAFTGSPPFTGPMASMVYKALEEEPVAPRQAGADVDEELEALILSCLAKDPGQRPATAEALADALEVCLAAQAPEILSDRCTGRTESLGEDGQVQCGYELTKTRLRETQKAPATIREAVARCVAGLSGEDLEVLSIASVLGRRFDYEDLELLAGRDVAEPCDRLLRIGLLKDPSSHGTEIVFAGAVLREVVYERLSYPIRRNLHRKYARELETRLASEPDQVAQRLARHFAAGQEPEEAVHYALRAARKSFQEMELEAVVGSVRTVLKFTGDSKWTGDPRPEAEARLLLSRTHREWGSGDEALEEAVRAAEVFEREDDLEMAAAAAVLATEIAWENRSVDVARRWFRTGRRWARKAGNTEQLIQILSLGEAIANYQEDFKRARRYRREASGLIDGKPEARDESTQQDTDGGLGDRHFVRGEFEAAQRAYVAAREKRLANGRLDPRMEATYLLKVGELAHKMGDYDRALAYCRQGVSLAEENDFLTTARLEGLAAMVCCSAGKTREAASWVEQGFLRLAEVAGGAERDKVEASLHRAHGNLLFDTGQAKEAVEAYRKSLSLWQETTDAWEESIAYFNLGEALAAVGRFDEALENLGEAFQAKSQLGDRWGLAYVYLVEARIRLDRGRTEEALAQARRGLDLATEVGDPKLGALLRVILGRGHLVAHDVGRAETEFHRALGAARQTQAHLVVLQARIGLARVNLGRGRFAIACRHAREARAEAEERGVGAELTAALVTLCNLERLLGSFDEAAELSRQALGLARRIGNYSLEHEVLFCWARLNLARSDPEAAKTQFETILDRARESGDGYHQGTAFAGLAEAYHQLREPSRAQEAAEAAIERFEASQQTQALASVYMLLSRHQLKIDTPRAVAHARRAVEMLEKEGETAFRMLGRLHLVLGQTHRENGKPREELEAFELARYYFSSAGDLSGLADSYRAMALTFIRDAPAKAAEMVRKSLKLTQEIGHHRGEAEAYGELGEIARRRGRLAEAEEAFQAEERVIERTGDLRRKSINAYHFATLELMQGRLHEAWRFSEECLEASDRIGRGARFFGLELRGRIAVELGRFTAAFEALEAALGEAGALNDESCSANIRLSRAHFFLELGLIERADAEVESGLVHARRLSKQASSMSSGYLVQERLELAAARLAMKRDCSSDAESEVRRLVGIFETLQTPIEEVEARLVWVDCLALSDELDQAVQQADRIDEQCEAMGLELRRCDALLCRAVLLRDAELVNEALEVARALPSPRRVVEALKLLTGLEGDGESAGVLERCVRELVAGVPAELRGEALADLA